MKGFFKTLQKDSLLLWSFWITIACVIAMIAATGISYTTLPPVLPLYNHMPWGYARLGKTYELFILPFVVLIVCGINVGVGIRFIEKTPLLARFLFLTMVSLAVFSLIFVLRLIFVTL